MKTLRQGNDNNQVYVLKQFLNALGANLESTTLFDNQTRNAVVDFQSNNNLGADGIVGKRTWRALFNQRLDIIIDNEVSFFLSPDQYLGEYKEKKYIYLHHTVGSHKPNNTISGWNRDGHGRVATSYVIGGKKYNGSDDSFDGHLYKCFQPYHWAFHLGVNSLHNNIDPPRARNLNAQSVGIEICSIGPLNKIGGKFFSTEYPSIEIEQNQVADLGKRWRDHRYFHKYSTKQLEVCERIILESAYIFDIPIHNMKYDRDWFDLKYDAIYEKSGIWTHCNLRYDKTDCFPQKELIEMLNGLYDKFQDYAPQFAIQRSSMNSHNILRSPSLDPATDEILGSKDLSMGES